MAAVRPRILVVEDDASNRKFLMLLLHQEGYAVAMVATLPLGILLCEGVAFDLVLTGSFARTPEAALTTTTALRQTAGSTPIILMTAHPITSQAAHEAGFAAVIAKPFDANDVRTRVREVLASASSS